MSEPSQTLPEVPPRELVEKYRQTCLDYFRLGIPIGFDDHWLASVEVRGFERGYLSAKNEEKFAAKEETISEVLSNEDEFKENAKDIAIGHICANCDEAFHVQWRNLAIQFDNGWDAHKEFTTMNTLSTNPVASVAVSEIWKHLDLADDLIGDALDSAMNGFAAIEWREKYVKMFQDWTEAQKRHLALNNTAESVTTISVKRLDELERAEARAMELEADNEALKTINKEYFGTIGEEADLKKLVWELTFDPDAPYISGTKLESDCGTPVKINVVAKVLADHYRKALEKICVWTNEPEVDEIAQEALK
jgi:hypothetical protein